MSGLPSCSWIPAVRRQHLDYRPWEGRRPTWKLAGEPDSDCTLTPHFSGSSRNASRARLCRARDERVDPGIHTHVCAGQHRCQRQISHARSHENSLGAARLPTQTALHMANAVAAPGTATRPDR
jgi:hypothetical protein